MCLVKTVPYSFTLIWLDPKIDVYKTQKTLFLLLRAN